MRDQDGAATDELRWLWLACRIASDLWDDETWEELATRHVRIARETGALAVLPLALTYRSGTHLHAGEFAAAAALIEEADALTRSIGSAPPLMYTTIVLAAWRGERGRRPSASSRSASGTRRPGARAGASAWADYADRRCSTTVSASTRPRCTAARRGV